MVNANTLKVSMPWGEEMLDLPLKNIIVFRFTEE
jgi:hypothetical protein